MHEHFLLLLFVLLLLLDSVALYLGLPVLVVVDEYAGDAVLLGHALYQLLIRLQALFHHKGFQSIQPLKLCPEQLLLLQHFVQQVVHVAMVV